MTIQMSKEALDALNKQCVEHGEATMTMEQAQNMLNRQHIEMKETKQLLNELVGTIAMKYRIEQAEVLGYVNLAVIERLESGLEKGDFSSMSHAYVAHHGWEQVKKRNRAMFNSVKKMAKQGGR